VSHPDLAESHALEGFMHYSQKNYEEAERRYIYFLSSSTGIRGWGGRLEHRVLELLRVCLV